MCFDNGYNGNMGMKRDFKKYLNPNFIETGSHTGSGIQAALKAGFKRIYSIELCEKYYGLCRDKFRKDKNVFLFFGNSVTWLPYILNNITGKCTFWLDAHFSGGDTANDMPLLRELDIITKRKGDIILIDDMRLFREGFAGITERDIIKALKGYKLSYEYGVAERDILIAQ